MTGASPTAGLAPADAAQVDDVVALARDVLGDAVGGIYLFGSAVRGGLRADSDLDLLIVTSRRTTEAERDAIIDGLLSRSCSAARPDRRHLEVTVVVAPDVRPWRYPPPMELQYGDWWRREFETGDRSPWTSPNADLAVVLTTVRDDGVALAGPPADAILDPVPRADLERAMRDEIPELLPGLLEDDTRNALLTLARIWLTLETGRIEPKDVAAAWAVEQLPDGAGKGLRLARSAYLGDAEDRWHDTTRQAARTDWDAILATIEGR